MAAKMFFAPLGDTGPKYELPARFTIRVDSLSSQAAEITVAVGFDQELKVMEARTPFEFTFSACRLTCLVASKNSDHRLEADLLTDLYGEFGLMSGHPGSSVCKFTFNPRGPIFSHSGGRF